jgi:SAM-dependent methyltransferase
VSLPLPPLALRELVGPTADAAFDNPDGAALYPDLPAQRIFDFGCGCGRLARRLILQRDPPERYVGVDLHRGMIDWARANLTPHAPQFAFHHLDVANVRLNTDGGAVEDHPFPVEDGAFSLALAHSVFTHVLQDHVPFYLRELARILEPGGVLHATWFTFDRWEFPMLRDEQFALYLDHYDPTHATIFDREWVRAQAAAAGLTIVKVVAPEVRGYHWYVDMVRGPQTGDPVAWPADADWVGNEHHPERRRWTAVAATTDEVLWLYRHVLGREPSPEEVATHAGHPLRDVLAAFRAAPETAERAQRLRELPGT